MRAGSRTAALVLALTAVVISSTALSAHRRDEYLQAARIGVEPGRVELELDLTPGIAVADAIIAEMDRDHDGVLSDSEKRAYVSQVLAGIDLHIDGRARQVDVIAATFSELDALRGGEGAVRLRAAVALPPMTDGRHQLSFRNTYRRDVSAYLANALAPQDDRIAVTAQLRTPDQQDLTIDLVVRAQPSASASVWLLAGLGGLGVLMALGFRARDERAASS